MAASDANWLIRMKAGHAQKIQRRWWRAQEARLSTAEVAHTPLTLLVALPRIPLGGSSLPMLRCGPQPHPPDVPSVAQVLPCCRPHKS